MNSDFPKPSGWRNTTVAQIASIITGPFGTLLKASEYGGSDGVPLISVGEIREGFLHVTDETPTVSESVTKRLPQYLMREGDIVFGRKGGVERSAFINRHQVGWFLGSDGISIRLREGFHRPFFGHAFRSTAVQSWLLQNASGTTMPSLNQSILGAVEIPFPDDPKEQHAIAEALSDADGVIEGLERLIAKKRRIKQGAMQDLLTARRRTSGRAPEWDYQGNPIGWERSELSELANFITGPFGSTFHKSDYVRSGVPLINPSHIVSGEIIPDDGISISADMARKLSVFALRENDVVIGRRGEMGRCAVVTASSAGFLCGTGSMIVRPKDLSMAGLLQVILSSPAVVGEIEENSAGTTMINLNQSTLASLRVFLPSSPDERADLASILSDMDDEIQTLETRLEKARQIKEGMMQNLLTGRIRLV